MAGCGYVCPQCECKGFTEDGSDCDWCAPAVKEEEENNVLTGIKPQNEKH